ncbi:hypothetical protein ACXHXG_31035 [Rhizobium sp. LEGMi198b]|uniref:hypothetical protein n=1 Tax=unclassified Rhizobium TaxID=2613769 RepID=UPI000CDF35AA|nr:MULTISPECIES: hypothetical protein [Rhizobium]AVA26298.1 hypothetical protein NXC24_PC01872 [Rhizobium sp. NXC24]MDK4741593.1 hypothetical protein [Rhizobium sp. CNPSo 3464]UWU23961.1 hypothetical protein N2601_27350 [Rhizobium tropici]WFU04886.1 hypothetical protein QA648_29465 [Rhizobium sp. CB3171]
MSRRGNLFAAVMLACVSYGGLLQAETISYADAVTKLADDCGADIGKFCKGLNLGGGRIADCLAQNEAKISPSCKTSVASVVQSITQREQAQSAYSQVCRGDIAMRCKGVKGDGYILACLNKGQKRVSDKCNQAITDAGWR